MDKIRTIATMTIESSELSCNFVNTVYAWRGENLHEYLGNYEDVIAWCRKLNVFEEDVILDLEAKAAEHPEEATGALEEIYAVRQMLYNLISAIAAGNQKSIEVLVQQINPYVSDALTHMDLTYQDDGFKIKFKRKPVDLRSPLWPVLKSLYDLLTNGALSRIKECPACGWVFIDETKNGKRRWCSPIDCGTKDKMQRYNQKKKSKENAAEC